MPGIMQSFLQEMNLLWKVMQTERRRRKDFTDRDWLKGSDMANYQTVQETEGDWVGPEYALVHGVRIAVWVVDPNFGEDLERFQTRKDDVFVASFPKSGVCVFFFLTSYDKQSKFRSKWDFFNNFQSERTCKIDFAMQCFDRPDFRRSLKSQFPTRFPEQRLVIEPMQCFKFLELP